MATTGFSRIENVRGGRVCLKGRRVGPWDLACRFAAGDSIKAIAHDMELTEAQVESALALWIEAAAGFNGWRIEKRMAALLEAQS